ncbi:MULTISPECIES: DNA-3-methyladenine glycosylase [unclassified Luteococcus]|uniref:DNA-3-methyladenine glycosylase n=1 Tax=unclassified Luteococcus TaxID=2639923 RepID=UPI00313BBFE3
MQSWSWLPDDAEQAARRLLGCELVRQIDGHLLRVRIVETEAYDQDDPASHSHHGRTARNDAMFLAAGHAYVYLIHGLHHCMNVVVGPEGYGCGVLIRAAEPLDGLDEMRRRRKGRAGVELTNGPGKLGQALGITLPLRGHDLGLPPLQLLVQQPVAADQIVVTTRVGITKNAAAPRRFYLRGNPWVSKPWIREP